MADSPQPDRQLTSPEDIRRAYFPSTFKQPEPTDPESVGRRLARESFAAAAASI